MKSIKAIFSRIFAPQKRPTEGKRVLILAASVYVLLLIWAIVFKFSFITKIDVNSPFPIGIRILRGCCFFDFVLDSNPWMVVRGALIAFLNILVFIPWGIYASFFYDKRKTMVFACTFSGIVECIQLFARFGVFSFEDVALNTFGACLGVLIYEKYICRISENTTQKINQWVARIGVPFAAIAYINTIVAMALYFS